MGSGKDVAREKRVLRDGTYGQGRRGPEGAVLEDRGKSRKLGKPHIINCRAFTVIVTVRRSNVNSAGRGERARIRR